MKVCELQIGQVYGWDDPDRPHGTTGYAMVLSTDKKFIELDPKGSQPQGSVVLLVTMHTRGEEPVPDRRCLRRSRQYDPAPELLEGWTVEQVPNDELPDSPTISVRVVGIAKGLSDCGGIDGARKIEAERRRERVGRVIDQIDVNIKELGNQIAEVYEHRDWEALGETNAVAYLETMFQGRLTGVPEAARKALVVKLDQDALPLLAIEAASGVSKSTAGALLKEVRDWAKLWKGLSADEQTGLIAAASRPSSPRMPAAEIRESLTEAGLVEMQGKKLILTTDGEKVIEFKDHETPATKASVRARKGRKASAQTTDRGGGKRQTDGLTEPQLRGLRRIAEYSAHPVQPFGGWAVNGKTATMNVLLRKGLAETGTGKRKGLWRPTEAGWALSGVEKPTQDEIDRAAADADMRDKATAMALLTSGLRQHVNLTPA